MFLYSWLILITWPWRKRPLVPLLLKSYKAQADACAIWGHLVILIFIVLYLNNIDFDE